MKQNTGVATEKVVKWVLLKTYCQKWDQTFKSSPRFQIQKRSQIHRVLHSHRLLVLAAGETQMHTHYSELGVTGLIPVSKETCFL